MKKTFQLHAYTHSLSRRRIRTALVPLNVSNADLVMLSWQALPSRAVGQGWRASWQAAQGEMVG